MKGTWCPQCGPHVVVDGDGCCTQCGATATGRGADLALAAVSSGDWRLGLPCPQDVADHEMRGGFWHVIRAIGEAVQITRLRTVQGKVTPAVHEQWAGTIRFRPINPEGTPVPWPER